MKENEREIRFIKSIKLKDITIMVTEEGKITIIDNITGKTKKG